MIIESKKDFLPPEVQEKMDTSRTSFYKIVGPEDYCGCVNFELNSNTETYLFTLIDEYLFASNEYRLLSDDRLSVKMSVAVRLFLNFFLLYIYERERDREREREKER